MALHPDFVSLAPFVRSLPRLFAEDKGKVIHKGRNELRVLSHEGKNYVVKSFRRPNWVNRFVYGFFRPSKAKRSFDNALLLQSIGVGTPQPVAYYNVRSWGGLCFEKSYFVTLCSEGVHRYAELFTTRFDYADEVLRAIGSLTAVLHEHRLAHKDYGRANILFRRTPEGKIELELVDLNRMYHGELDLQKGCRNFERLPATPHMHRLMAEAYAEARGFDAEECFRLMQAFRSTQPGKIDDKW